MPKYGEKITIKEINYTSEASLKPSFLYQPSKLNIAFAYPSSYIVTLMNDNVLSVADPSLAKSDEDTLLIYSVNGGNLANLTLPFAVPTQMIQQ